MGTLLEPYCGHPTGLYDHLQCYEYPGNLLGAFPNTLRTPLRTRRGGSSNVARTTWNTPRGPPKHTAGIPETCCGDPQNMLRRSLKYVARNPGNPIRVVIIGFQKKNCDNLLKGAKNYIFWPFLEGSAETPQTHSRDPRPLRRSSCIMDYLLQ